MRKRSKIKVFFVLTVLILIIFFGLYTAPNLYYSANKDNITEINDLREKLGMEVLNTNALQSANPLDIFSKLGNMLKIDRELGKTEEYGAQIEKIETEFEDIVSDYYSAIENFDLISGYIEEPQYENIAFETKKDPERFIQSIWPEIRSAYIKYNDENQEVIRFNFNPEIEVTLLTIEEKVGLLFGFGLKGKTMTTAEMDFFKEYNIGAVALFGHNIGGKEQLKNLTEEIQNASDDYPVLISTDQEGGTVKRLSWDTVGSPKQIAALPDKEACDAWKSRSNTLLESGINWNLGTIADVTQNKNSFIYPRVFSTDYDEAAKEVKIATECESVISTVKHWPGHGSTTVDTHMQLGELSIKDEESWLEKDNKPFQAGIDNGAETIMVGHLLMNWLNPDNPATLSEDAIDYLRNNLGFEGVIATDDMMMLTSSGYTIEKAVEEAILAGNDFIFVVNNDINTLKKLYNIALDLVESGQITEEDLNVRVVRILKLKQQVLNL